MDLDSLDDDDAKQLAARIGPHLEPGSYGDRVVLTKRQFIAAATGVAGAGALATWGVDDATAQAAGQQGTASSPNNMFAYDLNVANAVTSSLPMNGNAIEGASSVSTDSLGITGAGTLLSSGQAPTVMGGSASQELSSVSATTYTNIATASGTFPLDVVPDAVTVEARFAVRGGVGTDGETLSVRPELISFGGKVVQPDELEVTTTSTSFTNIDSGWTEFTSISTDDTYFFDHISAKVSGGEAATFSESFAALAIRWRIN